MRSKLGVGSNALITVCVAGVSGATICGQRPKQQQIPFVNPSPAECRQAVGVVVPQDLIDGQTFLLSDGDGGLLLWAPWQWAPGPYVVSDSVVSVLGASLNSSELSLARELRDVMTAEYPWPGRVQSLVDSLSTAHGSSLRGALEVMMNGFVGVDEVLGLGDFYAIAGGDFKLAVLLLMHSGIPFNQRLAAWDALSTGLQVGNYTDTATAVSALMSLACDAAFIVRPFTQEHLRALSDRSMHIYYKDPTEPVPQALASAGEAHDYAFRFVAYRFPSHARAYLARYADWEPDTVLAQGVRELIDELDYPARQREADPVERALFALEMAIGSYWADSATYTRDLETLRSHYWPVYETWPGVTLEVHEAGPMGWSSTARDERTGRLCAFFVGDARPVPPAKRQGMVACKE
jgi:hypothetical protein